METKETNAPLEYGKPPWVFKGRQVNALYQLHLVKADTARALIPKEFKLVEAFGYTLGGFFLANYEDSPAGIFDELVVIAGIVWNPPTSCAWAARVLVNSDKACIHGRKDVGLPSQVANFTKASLNMPSVTALPGKKRNRFGGFLSKIGMAESPGSMKNCMDIKVEEMENQTAMDICRINLTAAVAAQSITLTSSSTLARWNAVCIDSFRLRVVSPAKVSGPSSSDMDGEIASECESSQRNADCEDYKRDLSVSVMLSKPILALEFNCLKMKVEAPTMVNQ
ncbi:hypothetical protein BUALT_Bualt17G0009800 [Buddleja alternifolia]|uniref:Protein NEOXANTHIN-DEFICIENT 1 n=1 Tax=Buddleja alternifolia TaxID=168488 RepID=A0AAV6W5D1_9LAMI|nr:hypothetical protein BUALT_Bualt17G0009800 [Buddleja alternifolia]